MPSRAIGLTAAASKAREWIGVPAGAIFIIGWIVGITWLTLPTSDEPRRSPSGGPSAMPSAFMLARKAPSSVSFRFIVSYTVSSLRITLRPQPVDFAAPSAQAITRLWISHM